MPRIRMTRRRWIGALLVGLAGGWGYFLWVRSLNTVEQWLCGEWSPIDTSPDEPVVYRLFPNRRIRIEVRKRTGSVLAYSGTWTCRGEAFRIDPDETWGEFRSRVAFILRHPFSPWKAPPSRLTWESDDRIRLRRMEMAFGNDGKVWVRRSSTPDGPSRGE